MNCKNVKELVGPYLYGDLAPEEMRAVRTHAQGCKRCSDDIKSQMLVIGALPGAAPELSDEERQRIAWTVKGAVKAAEPERRLRWFGLSPAYAMAAAVVIGMIGVAVTSLTSPKPVVGEKARVVVTEVQAPQPVNKDKVVERPKREERKAPAQDVAQAPEEESDSAASRHGARPQIIDGVNNIRRMLPMSTLSNRHGKPNKPAVVPPEPPAPVVDPSETPDVRVETGEDKLPVPADVNDAQTAPKDSEDANVTEEAVPIRKRS